jgi:hypothetical protein
MSPTGRSRYFLPLTLGAAQHIFDYVVTYSTENSVQA